MCQFYADPNSVAPVKYTMTSVINLFSYPQLFERAGIPSDRLPTMQQKMQAYVNSCGAASSNCQPPGIARCAAGEWLTSLAGHALRAVPG